MPVAVYDSHKSGVERNMLGRLQTLTDMFQELNVTGYLRGEVGFSGHLFSTAIPEYSRT